MVNNFLKNNLAILFGNVFFKIGGYIYKFLMVYLLNNYAYGILTIISPFQNIFVIYIKKILCNPLKRNLSR